MADFETFINAADDLTDVELASYFDEACGDDERSRAESRRLLPPSTAPGEHPASPEFDEKLKQ